MKIYLSGHIPRESENSPAVHWRDILVTHFDSLVKTHYKNKKVYPMPSIEWISPLDASKVLMQVNAARDKMLMNQADLGVVYLNLNIGRCLGAMYEMGYLAAHDVPIVLINMNTDVSATHFIEHNADVVIGSNLSDAAKIIYDMVKDIQDD